MVTTSSLVARSLGWSMQGNQRLASSHSPWVKQWSGSGPGAYQSPRFGTP